jgi:integrase
VGRRSTTGGVTPFGQHRIQFDFTIDGRRYRPTLPWTPHEANLRRARELSSRIRAQIAAGTFSFTEQFPTYRLRKRLAVPLRARTCSDVFDAFLAHEEARVGRRDLAPITLATHRQILEQVWRPTIGSLPLLAIRYSMLVKVVDAHRWTKKTYNNVISALRRAFAFGFEDHPEQHNPAQALRSARIGKKDRPVIDPFSIQDAEVLIAAIHRDWGEAQGNYDEFRFFTGLRPSEQIALVVSDFDPVNGTLSVSKARVAGIDRDRTKTGEDRRIDLCPRARAVLERQLRLRNQFSRAGHLNHQQLFFDTDGTPIRRLREPYERWHRTLQSLAIRYRKPYAARHSSVSWNLMTGRNPLRVAKQHGHSVLTMLTVYAAWTEGALEADVAAIRRAMRGPACATRLVPTDSVPPPSPELKANAPAERSIQDTAKPRARQERSTKQAPGTTARVTQADLAADLSVARTWNGLSARGVRKMIGGADGTRTRDPRRDRPVF